MTGTRPITPPSSGMTHNPSIDGRKRIGMSIVTDLIDDTMFEDGVRRAPLALDTRADFRRDGFADLHDLWSPAVSDALAEEARRLFARAEVPSNGPRTPVSEHRATGRGTPVATGPILDHLHRAIATHVRALSGRMLVPSFANYGYFADEDGVILHLDTDATEVVVLTTALGATGPLHVHPELQGLTPTELGVFESDPDWDDSAAVRLTYPTHGATALRGARLPHRRPSRPVASLSAVAALHYRSPFLPGPT